MRRDWRTCWYVPPALRGTGGESRQARLRIACAGLVAGLIGSGFVGCGDSGTRQDEAEPAKSFPVAIVKSQFPNRQRLAQTTQLRLAVQNTGTEALPELAITISIAGPDGQNSIRPFSVRDPQSDLAAPDRPVWVLEEDWPRVTEDLAVSAGAQTANEKTFAFGELKAGDTVEAVWKVTPVKAGNYTLLYEVDAGLGGKAKAKTADGNQPAGSFVVRISDVPPQTRVNDQGEVVEITGGVSGDGGSGGSGSGGSGGSGSGGADE
jgi:uncharacterized membrane protein YgcG